jgi:hypothetical protein
MFENVEGLPTESADKREGAVEGEDQDLKHYVVFMRKSPRAMSCYVKGYDVCR